MNSKSPILSCLLPCAVLFAPALARAETPARAHAAASPGDAGVRPWSRRFPPPATVPALLTRPVAAPRITPPPRPQKTAPVVRSAPAAAPASTPPPEFVFIEVREIKTGQASQIERFSVPLGEHDAARIETHVGDVDYSLSAKRQGIERTAPIAFEVRKSQRGPKSVASESQVRTSLRMANGTRVLIASIDRADGSRTEVLAELK
ncbi:MAG: hypothetical protein U0263_25215 [Polyangiaceae bacterium]